VFLAARLHKPILLEGPAGAGKTEMAVAVHKASGLPLIRLQCYTGSRKVCQLLLLHQLGLQITRRAWHKSFRGAYMLGGLIGLIASQSGRL